MIRVVKHQSDGQNNTLDPKLQNTNEEKQDVIEFYSSGEKAEHFTSVEDLLNNLDSGNENLENEK